jgi:hypothetical protein
VRYDVRVLDRGGRFEHEQDEPLAAGDTIGLQTMIYRVVSIRPLADNESDEFDAIAEVRWLAGPAEAGYHGP